MIKEVQGDILLTSAQVIAHSVGPYDNFAQGLALSLREMWPSLYKDFRHYCHSGEANEGSLWVWRGVGGPTIINLFIQESAKDTHSHPGRAKIENVNHALKELRKVLIAEKFTSLAMPRLATGVGGLDWGQVRPLIDKYFSEFKFPIYLYTTYHKDQKAKED